MEPRFEALSSTSGLSIFDPIEKRKFSLLTPNPVSPAPANPDEFYFPVSTARRIQTTEIELPYTISIYVRGDDGTMVEAVEPPADLSLPRDQYLIELSSPVKLYLRADTRMEISADTETVRFSFGDETAVTVGARSRHESPAGTITVPDDPKRLMEALSASSSSLKTTSPERSFATLRGHPPRFERGNNLQIPDDFEHPDTGVTIEVPPEYAMIYPVAPLAFYLGAEVVPGTTPLLRTENGFEHRLDSHRGYEQEVERVLKQMFLLDCVVRTEGYYPIELAERTAVEPHLNFDLADLYDRPLAERVEQYLGVPYGDIADAVPTWHRVTFARPVAENAELLPHVVNDLSLIRTPPDEEPAETTEEADTLWNEIEGFQRGPDTGDSREDRRDSTDRNFVSIPETDTIETAWAGEGTPTSGTKLLPGAYEHERTPPEDHVIDVTVVCNDSRMRREWDAVAEIYGRRDDVAIEADVAFGVGTDELRELLAEPTDLFHYIGHVEESGFECLDDFLDAKALDDVGMKAFVLNACNSHSQGEALIEAGASAGIVSLSEVGNRSAVEFGEVVTKLFNYGFSVGSVISIIDEYTAVGSRYIGLGDVGLTLAQTENQFPVLYEIVEASGTDVTVDAYAYTTQNHPFGGFSSLYRDTEYDNYLNPGYLTTFEVSNDRFNEIIGRISMPLIVGGGLRWSDDWCLESD